MDGHETISAEQADMANLFDFSRASNSEESAAVMTGEYDTPLQSLCPTHPDDPRYEHAFNLHIFCLAIFQLSYFTLPTTEFLTCINCIPSLALTRCALVGFQSCEQFSSQKSKN